MKFKCDGYEETLSSDCFQLGMSSYLNVPGYRYLHSQTIFLMIMPASGDLISLNLALSAAEILLKDGKIPLSGDIPETAK